MLEEPVASAPSIWATVNSWFTPSVLFLLLNLMIGTIAITSSLSSHKAKPQEEEGEQEGLQHQHQHQQYQYSVQELPKPQHLARSPSMLQRLKSMSLHIYRSQEPNAHYDKAPEMETDYHVLQQNPELEHEQERESPKETPLLARSPSVLERLKSMNLHKYFSQESSFSLTHFASHQPREPESGFQAEQQEHEEKEVNRLEDEDAEQEQEEEEEEEEEGDEEEEEEQDSIDEIYGQLKGNQVSRTKSDTKPASGELLPKLPTKMRKSASEKSAFAHFEEDDIAEFEAGRPATVREGKSKAGHHEVDQDEEVDARADDFINRFKQQLKLQRMDSVMRYKEMITRGSGK